MAQRGLTHLIIQGGEPWSFFLSAWQRWDALWYTKIVTEGYGSDGTLNFYPLYPLLSRGVAFVLGGHLAWALLVVTSVCFVLALRLLYELAYRESEGNRRVATLAVLLLALFPSGFFLLAPFTESLFLTITMGTFWLMHRQRWWLAGGAGFLAALTRANGVAMVFPLAVAYLRGRQRWPAGEAVPAAGLAGRLRGLLRVPGWGLLPALGPVVGAAVWTTYPRLILGESDAGGTLIVRALSKLLAIAPGQAAGSSDRATWRLVPPWETLSAGFAQAVNEVGYVVGSLPVPYAFMLPGVELLNFVALVGCRLLAVVALRRLPLEYSAFVLPNLAILLTRQMTALPLESLSRYALVLFPVFIVGAQLLARRPRLAATWLVLSAGLQLVLFQAFTRWRFVG